MTHSVSHLILTAVVHDSCERVSTVKRHLGHKHLVAQATVIAVLRSMCRSFKSAYWTFHELSNGGFYMAPNVDSPLQIGREGETLSADAAGILACLLVWKQIAKDTQAEQYRTLYETLHTFARTHAESKAILSLNDAV